MANLTVALGMIIDNAVVVFEQLNPKLPPARGELNPEAVEIVEQKGVVQGDKDTGYEISCIDSGECIFVQKDKQGVATCAIQSAYFAGKFHWEKPISCHLYPIRLKHIAGLDYANFEYIPELCSAGCRRGEEESIYLADFLKEALSRRYGESWYNEFLEVCKEVRNETK